MFDQHCVLEPAAAEAVREGDNREWHAALGDRRVFNRMRGNLSERICAQALPNSPLMILWISRKGVHLSRAWEVLSFCAVGLRRRIPKVDHQLATEFGIVSRRDAMRPSSDSQSCRCRKDLLAMGSVAAQRMSARCSTRSAIEEQRQKRRTKRQAECGQRVAI